MNLMKKYFKNREIFEFKISNFFNKVNVNYELSYHMFTFIDNEKLYIITYDFDLDKNLDIFNIYNINNSIFETNNINDLINKIYTFKIIQYKLRLKKFLKLL